MVPRETENNAYAKFWGDKQRTLWYVMVFLEWSIKCTPKSIKFKQISLKELPLELKELIDLSDGLNFNR